MSLRTTLSTEWKDRDIKCNLSIKCRNCNTKLRNYTYYNIQDGEKKVAVDMVLLFLENDRNFNYCNNCGVRLR